MKRTISLWLGLLAFALVPALAQQPAPTAPTTPAVPTGKVHGHVTNPTGASQTGGTVTLSASSSTPAQSQKVAEMPQAERVIYCKEYKGHWYIDMAAMSQLQQEQSQPSSTTPAPPSTP